VQGDGRRKRKAGDAYDACAGPVQDFKSAGQRGEPFMRCVGRADCCHLTVQGDAESEIDIAEDADSSGCEYDQTIGFRPKQPHENRDKRQHQQRAEQACRNVDEYAESEGIYGQRELPASTWFAARQFRLKRGC